MINIYAVICNQSVLCKVFNFGKKLVTSVKPVKVNSAQVFPSIIYSLTLLHGAASKWESWLQVSCVISLGSRAAANCICTCVCSEGSLRQC